MKKTDLIQSVLFAGVLSVFVSFSGCSDDEAASRAMSSVNGLGSIDGTWRLSGISCDNVNTTNALFSNKAALVEGSAFALELSFNGFVGQRDFIFPGCTLSATLNPIQYLPGNVVRITVGPGSCEGDCGFLPSGSCDSEGYTIDYAYAVGNGFSQFDVTAEVEAGKSANPCGSDQSSEQIVMEFIER